MPLRGEERERVGTEAGRGGGGVEAAGDDPPGDQD